MDFPLSRFAPAFHRVGPMGGECRAGPGQASKTIKLPLPQRWVGLLSGPAFLGPARHRPKHFLGPERTPSSSSYIDICDDVAGLGAEYERDFTRT